jgi:hypothetical protein
MSGQTVQILGDRSRLTAHRLVDAAPFGAVVNVRESRRTGEQNDKLWAMLSDVSRAMPEGRRHTPEVWKALFMAACGHAVQFEMGLDGAPFPVGFRSSRLSKRQMSDLIEFIYSWATPRGVVWSAEEIAA